MMSELIQVYALFSGSHRNKKSIKKQTIKLIIQNKQILTMVNYIKSMDEFNAMLETSKSKAVIIDFTATW